MLIKKKTHPNNKETNKKPNPKSQEENTSKKPTSENARRHVWKVRNSTPLH